MAKHNELGKKGEQIAADYLIKQGYTILEKNYRYYKAEIDIIAQKDSILAVVEVKTRTTNYFGSPQDFVNNKKIKLMFWAIDNYIIKKDLDIEARFDIIAITLENETKIEHIKDAFFSF